MRKVVLTLMFTMLANRLMATTSSSLLLMSKTEMSWSFVFILLLLGAFAYFYDKKVINPLGFTLLDTKHLAISGISIFLLICIYGNRGRHSDSWGISVESFPWLIVLGAVSILIGFFFYYRKKAEPKTAMLCAFFQFVLGSIVAGLLMLVVLYFFLKFFYGSNRSNKCHRCGTRLSDRDTFCPNCGAKRK